jgi:serine acetyltransferase
LPYKYVIGRGRELQRALAAWRELAPDTELLAVDMDVEGSRATLDNIDPLEATAFVAADAYFLNFHRLELMGGVRARGIAMPPLVERGAIVGADVKILDNTWIGAGAVIQPGCRIGFNVVIGPGAIVGGGAEIGQSAFVDAGVTVGHGAKIGSKATLGLGVAIGHGVEIGALCVIDKAGRYDTNVAAKTFIQASHTHPIVIVCG